MFLDDNVCHVDFDSCDILTVSLIISISISNMVEGVDHIIILI